MLQSRFYVAVTLLVASAPVAARAYPADPSQKVQLNPGYHTPAMFAPLRQGPAYEAKKRTLAAGTVLTLPTWTRGFSINGTNYSYTMVGSDPAAGATTTIIPTVLVPIRLTVPDTLVNGQPLMLDATGSIPSILHSPIFTASKFDSGNLQFADAMLHAEFPQAPKKWHLYFSPSVAPTIDIVAPAGTVKTYQAKSGAYLGVVERGSVFGKPISEALHRQFAANTYVIFVSYNSLFSGAFGFHGDLLNKQGTADTVYAYNSWLVGVNDLFSLPSPNADTFAHEIAETVHDPVSTSLTLEWGDWFNNNRCFQPFIEVGDAVEDAPAKVQNYHQKVNVNGKEVVYTLQTEAMLPWFTREYPSSAIHGAYSFPGETALLGPAPFTCKK
jgi:hypothetical protein